MSTAMVPEIQNENLLALNQMLATGDPLPKLPLEAAADRMYALVEGLKAKAAVQTVLDQARTSYNQTPDEKRLPFPAYVAQITNLDAAMLNDPQMAALWVAGNQFMNALIEE